MASKIRSGYQRRVLDWLADGGGKISEAAVNLGLRLPHASATFKKMRTEGLITVDQSEHQKGSIQRLTSEGWAKLELDELARLSDINLNKIPENAEGCLIARDGPMILLGYLKKPTKEGFILPSTPITASDFESQSSTRNKGVEAEWTWAISREFEIRWFSIPTLERIKEPEQSNPEGITEWDQKEKAICIIRARLLEPEKKFSLPVGSWFPKTPENIFPKLPTLLNEDYSWTLATFHDDKHKIKPQRPVIAEIGRRLGINLLLEAAACDGIIIGEASLLSREVNEFPIKILEYWVKRIHPKLTEKSQNERFEFILEELGIVKRVKKKRRTSGEQATWSKFKLDWGNSKWSEQEKSNELFFDNSQIRKNALMSIIEWVMKDFKGVPLSIQWPRNIELSNIDSDVILRHPALRIIIIEKWNGRKPNLMLRETKQSNLPIMNLHLDRGIILPISVEISTTQSDVNIAEENYTIPAELMRLMKKSQIDINLIKSNLIIECCKQYPTGNEFEANKLEFENPLESWIITPSNLRWLRWQRISNRIEPHWVELLPPELIPIEFIGKIALNAPNEWKLKSRKILISNLQNNPDSSLNYRKILLNGSEEEKAWWFSCLISSAPWLAPSIRINLIKLGLKPWIKLNQKLSLGDFNEVLNILHWMQKLNEIDDHWISTISNSEINDEDSKVAIWKKLISKYETDINLTFDDASKIISKGDIEWWAPLAEELLKICMDSSKGRSWLESENISWSAAILREPKEIHQLPGFGEIKHPGCNSDLFELLLQTLDRMDSIRDKEGILQLLDLKNSLEFVRKGVSPTIGKSHKHISWLVQPLELWPDLNLLIDFEGDENVSKRILSRKTGFHENLRNSPQLKIS